MRFHHVGVACAAISRELPLMQMLGYTPDGPVFEDPIQGIRGQFLTAGAMRFELLEELPGSGVLQPWRKHGSSMYHHAYEVDDIDATIKSLRDSGCKLVNGPVPAVAFGGRSIAFLLMRNLILIELIQAAS